MTVTDFFYADKTSRLCTTGLDAPPCLSAASATQTIGAALTTTYYAPVIMSNPVSCTRTNFAHTTAESIFLHLDGSSAIPTPAEQATQTAQALFVITSVSTLSTNLGGREVTTSICKVYLRYGAIIGLNPSAQVQLEYVDPRSYDCSVAQARASQTWEHSSKSAACRTDQKFFL